MNCRERFLRTMNFEQPDRLPMVEWAGWWDKTLDRWRTEGLPVMEPQETREYLGLDMFRQLWFSPKGRNCPKVPHGKGFVKDMASYLEAREKCLYPLSKIEDAKAALNALKPLHDRGELVFWISLDGFFWFPRGILGIEEHMYMFYDDPELMHRINEDLCNYNIRLLEELCAIIKPDFMTFAEDMSYNHGPMLSKELFDEFLLPYYKRIIPVVKKHGIIPFVDTDGQAEPMIPWLIEAGIEGILPLERQAGVDVSRIRKNHPTFKIIGAYDKMVMSKTEGHMRAEFERLLPVMKSGGFIPACDHQTPPEVSFENYKIYLSLMEEYCRKAAQ